MFFEEKHPISDIIYSEWNTRFRVGMKFVNKEREVLKRNFKFYKVWTLAFGALRYFVSCNLSGSILASPLKLKKTSFAQKCRLRFKLFYSDSVKFWSGNCTLFWCHRLEFKIPLIFSTKRSQFQLSSRGPLWTSLSCFCLLKQFFFFCSSLDVWSLSRRWPKKMGLIFVLLLFEPGFGGGVDLSGWLSVKVEKQIFWLFTNTTLKALPKIRSDLSNYCSCIENMLLWWFVFNFGSEAARSILFQSNNCCHESSIKA